MPPAADVQTHRILAGGDWAWVDTAPVQGWGGGLGLEWAEDLLVAQDRDETFSVVPRLGEATLYGSVMQGKTGVMLAAPVRWVPGRELGLGSAQVSVIAAWDQYGTESAFSDFPLISHLAISPDQMPLVLARARELSEGRKITDRVCRCAGKLAEAISVERASSFAPHLQELRALKASSKIFFRVPIEIMEQRAEALLREPSSLELDFEDGTVADYSIALESLWERGLANRWIREGIESWEDPSPSKLAVTALELVSRHSIRGYEEHLLTLVDRDEASIADLATIALVRGRNLQTQSLIAERFQGMSKPGQLRSLDIIRRMRLEQSSKLIRF